MGKTRITYFWDRSLIVLFASLLIACAQVGSPTGGNKDETPPKLIKSFPLNHSVRYNENLLSLTFDEFIQVKDVTNELLISPPLGSPPQLKIKGKTLVLEFKENFRDNTTYTFDFGKSISDFTEGNPLDSNVFVFSTGNTLDSLSIRGKVKKIQDGSAEKGIFVMLYENVGDSVPYKEKPLYLTRTKEDGSYAINNVKQGIYRLFALKDLNNNLMFDQPTELIAFSDSLVNLDSSMAMDLLMFEEVQEKQFVKKTEVEQYGKLNLIFNLPVDSLDIHAINHTFDKNWYMEERGTKNDTVGIWFTNIGENMESLQLLVKDYKTLSDTINFKIGDKVKPSGARKGKPAPLILEASLNANESNQLFPDKNLQMVFNHPIAQYDFSKAKLIKGLDTLVLNYEPKVKSTSRTFELKHQWEEDSLYKLFIPAGAFKDIFNLENDTLNFTFKKKKAESLGDMAITLKIPHKQHQFILQLCKDKATVLSERVVKHDETVTFLNLEPGPYVIKVIYDQNNNGKWDTGKYLEKKQPEKILYYNGEVTIRPNWDLDLDWILEEPEVGGKRKLEK